MGMIDPHKQVVEAIENALEEVDKRNPLSGGFEIRKIQDYADHTNYYVVLTGKWDMESINRELPDPFSVGVVEPKGKGKIDIQITPL